ncbi:MAG: hypothetical protein M3N57_08015 [Actinomycetota bacterium]|nr:hypothetical protein [Actinomycetota bacterium]
MATHTPSSTRPPAATAVAVLALLGVVGSVVMMLAHLGLGIPVIENLGPGRMLLPVAIGFAVGALLYAVVAAGAFAVARWAWWAGLVVNGLAFLSAAFPFRGWISAVVMAVSAAALVVLLTPAGREAFGRR